MLASNFSAYWEQYDCRLQILEPMVEERGEFVFLLVGAALLFGAGIWAVEGPDKGAEYFAGYLLEQSLSVE